MISTNILKTPYIPYLEHSHLHSSLASISQCLRDPQMQQYATEFYPSLQKINFNKKNEQVSLGY